MKTKRFLALVLCLVMVMTMLGGCGDSNTGDQSSSNPQPTVSVNTGEVGEVNTDQEYEESVVIGWSGDIITGNPYGVYQVPNRATTQITHRTLTNYNAAESTLDYVLAESVEDVNGDGKTFKVTLKQGVLFHNGVELTAEDVKYTWEACGTGGTQTNAFPIAAYTYVDSIECPDKYTVVFNLNTKMLDFAYYLDSKILCKSACEELGFDKGGVIGTGPYYFDEDKYVSDVEWVLTRFEDSFEGAENYATKYIVNKVLPDTNTRMASLQNSETDALIEMLPYTYNTMSTSDGVKILNGGGGQLGYMGFNYHKTFDVNDENDTKLRQAIATALDIEAISTVTVGAVGEATDHIVPETGVGYAEINYQWTYNMEKADQMLAELGYGTSGKTLELTLIYYAGLDQAAQAVQAYLSQVNVNVTLNQVDPANVSSLKASGEGYDMFLDLINYSGAMTFMFDRMFRGGNSIADLYGYNSDTFNEKLNWVMNADSVEEEETRFAELQQWVSDEVVIMPIFFVNNWCPVREDVEGLQVQPTSTYTDLSTIRIPKR